MFYIGKVYKKHIQGFIFLLMLCGICYGFTHEHTVNAMEVQQPDEHEIPPYEEPIEAANSDDLISLSDDQPDESALFLPSEEKFSYNIYFDPILPENSDKFDTFVIDFCAECAPEFTYWSLCTGYINVEPYAFNLKPESGGVYAGFQNNSDNNMDMISSLWNVKGKDGSVRNGNIVKGNWERFGGEGNGYKSLNRYDWEANHWYRMLYYTYQEDNTTYISQWVKDLESDKWTLISTINTNMQNSYFMGAMSMFMENYVTETNLCARSFKLKNIYVRNYEDKSWISLNKGNMSYDYWSDLEDGSHNKIGSHEFGIKDNCFYGESGRIIENQIKYNEDSIKKGEYEIVQPSEPDLSGFDTTKLDGNYETKIVEEFSESTRMQEGAFVDDQGSLYVWGSNEYGQLGVGNTNDISTPVVVEVDVEKVFRGSKNLAIVKKDGSIWISGDNTYNQLANGGRESSYRFEKITGLSNIVDVRLLNTACVVLDSSGNVYSWGDWSLSGFEKKSGSKSEPTFLLANIDKLAGGSWASNGGAIDKNGVLHLWGEKYVKQSNKEYYTSNMYELSLEERIKDVQLFSGGVYYKNSYGLILLESGKLYGWGNFGNVAHYLNSLVLLNNDVVDTSLIKGRWNNYIVRLSDGGLFSTGGNHSGELGCGWCSDSIWSNAHVNLPDTSIKKYETSANPNNYEFYGWSAALTETGDLYVWGDEYYYQLGIPSSDVYQYISKGVYSPRACVTPYKLLSNIEDFEIFGVNGGLAIDKDGNLWGWGNVLSNTKLDAKPTNEHANYIFNSVGKMINGINNNGWCIIFNPGDGKIIRPTDGMEVSGIYDAYTDEFGKLNKLPEATKKDYIFGGWFTDEKYGEKVDNLGFTENTTLYARFFKKNEIWYKSDMANFINSFEYRMDDDTWEKFTSNLNIYEKYIVNSKKSSTAKFGTQGGICYGISSLIVAYKNGWFSPRMYGVDSINELNPNNKDVQSLLTRFFYGQYTNIYAKAEKEFGRLSSMEKLAAIVALGGDVEYYDGSPSVFVYNIPGGGILPSIFVSGSHAVVIDGIETGRHIINNVEYYYQVKTYDINSKEGVDTTVRPYLQNRSKSDIYISKDFTYWTIDDNDYFSGKKMTAREASSYMKALFRDKETVLAGFEKNYDKLGCKLIRGVHDNANYKLSANGKTVAIEKGNIVGENTLEVIIGQPIYGVGEGMITIYLPDDVDEITIEPLNRGDKISAIGQSDDLLIDVNANAQKAVINFGRKNATMVELAGDYSMAVINDGLSSESVVVSGSTDGNVNVESSDAGIIVAAENCHDISVATNDGNERLYEEKEVLIIDTGEGEYLVYSDIDDDGIFENQLEGAMKGVEVCEMSLDIDKEKGAYIGVNLYVKSNPDVFYKIDDIEVIPQYDSGSGLRKIQYRCPVKNFADEHVLKAYDAEGIILDIKGHGKEYKYSGVKYCELALAENSVASDELKKVCEALCEYNKQARKYFDYHTEGLDAIDNVDAQIPQDKYAQRSTGNLHSQCEYFGSSLVLKDDIVLRHYFDGDITEGGKYSVICKDIAKDIEKNFTINVDKTDDMVRIDIPVSYVDADAMYEISLVDLADNEKTVFTLDYGVFTYCNKAREYENKKGIINLCNALYNFSVSIQTYFETS